MYRPALPSFAIAFLAISTMAPAADLPSGESLLQHSFDRSGGAEAYAKAKNVEMNGTLEITGRNLSGKVSIVEEGKKSWTAMDLPGIGRIEQGFDGETAWEMSALQGARIIEGEEKEALKRASSFALITSWREDYTAVRTAGEESVNGKPAWKVEMTPKTGRVETLYFDKDSGLLVRAATVMSTPLGDIPTDMILSDYRLLDGIQTPFAMTQKAMGQSIEMRFDRIVYNAPLPKDRFELPAEVKAVLNKSRAQ